MPKSNEKSSESKPTHPRSVRVNVHNEAVQVILDYVQAVETRKIYSRPEDLAEWSKAFNAEMRAIDRMHALAAVLKLSNK